MTTLLRQYRVGLSHGEKTPQTAGDTNGGVTEKTATCLGLCPGACHTGPARAVRSKSNTETDKRPQLSGFYHKTAFSAL